jgi:predicted metal-dependent hydrolase
VNKTENIVEYQHIGKVRYVWNRRARNLAIRISRTGGIRVTVPGFVSGKQAERFVLERKEWIKRKLLEIARRTESDISVNNGDLLFIRGEPVKISVQGRGEKVEDALWRILLAKAKEYLPERVKELAGQGGFTYNGVKVRKMTSRWGSCSARNAINLNSWLVMVPDHLIDYVILHELVHTVHKDHGPGFWEALDKCTDGRSKELRKELHAHRIMSINSE